MGGPTAPQRPAPQGWIVAGDQHQAPPPPGPPQDHRSQATPYIIATFTVLGVGCLVAFGAIPQMGQIEALLYAIPLLLAAGVIGIIGAVIAGRERRSGTETAAATAGAVAGVAGASVAAIVAIVLVVLAIMAAFFWMMTCVMSFGMAC